MKGQLKIFETIAVLVVFFFLIAFGLNFYFFIQKSTLDREVRQIQDRRAVDIAQRITFLPELDCNLVGVVRENCFDKLKLASMSKLLDTADSQQAYFPILGYATIKVSQLYPQGETIKLYDRKKPGGRELNFQTPILIYEPVARVYYFGLLEARVYE